MEKQVTLTTEDIAAAIRQYAQMPQSNVRFVADVSHGNLDLVAIVSASSGQPETGDMKQIVSVTVAPPK